MSNSKIQIGVVTYIRKLRE